MTARLAVDVGGTFTDLMFCDDATNTVVVAKGPTTPDAPNRGVVDLVRSAVTPEQLADVSHFMHGSTVGLNALIQRSGARVGLLTTEGFRDALEIRRGDRDTSPYDILWRTPDPLIPRDRRQTVPERIDFRGDVQVALEPRDVAAAAAHFEAEDVESVAIVFLNSYLNPAHELEAAQALLDAGFSGQISLSHEISGEAGFYERTSTTAIDAYIRPLMSTYLSDLESELSAAGLAGDCLITRSGGGALPFADAVRRPFETAISGPVGGAVGAAKLCSLRGVKQAITADVGGTSFDTCLIMDGQPHTKYEGSVDGMPVRSPWIDVRSVGAGGGSLAFVDAGGRLRVGPESSGAVPGPVCYSRGGRQPTVTDAAAVLGMLGEGRLAGGLLLDLAAAGAAISDLGQGLGLDIDETASGVVRIAVAAMAAAVRTITVEQGVDPRESALVSFGGAGSLFGALLADELGITEVLVPLHAGNYSAAGLLGSGIVRSAARTSTGLLDDDLLRRAGRLSTEMFKALPPVGDRELALDLRYAGQLHTLTVTIPSENGRPVVAAEGVAELFSQDYERTFGQALPAPVEMVAVRATTRVLLEELPLRADGANRPREDHEFEVYSFRRAARLPFTVVDRAALPVEAMVSGPLIITEPTTTTYVDAGFGVETQRDGVLSIKNLEVSPQ